MQRMCDEAGDWAMGDGALHDWYTSKKNGNWGTHWHWRWGVVLHGMHRRWRLPNCLFLRVLCEKKNLYRKRYTLAATQTGPLKVPRLSRLLLLPFPFPRRYVASRPLARLDVVSAFPMPQTHPLSYSSDACLAVTKPPSAILAGARRV